MITTIIPTFRRPALLVRAIQSALNQTFQNIRIMVLDNCSNDETPKFVASLSRKDPRITYYRHPRCIDAVENFLYGFSQVDTPFFSILADDDYLDCGFYEKALEGMTKYPKAVFFLGSTIDVDKDGKMLRNSALGWPDKEYYESGEGAGPVISQYINWTGTLFRKEVLNSNTLDPDVKAVDFDFMIRLALQYPFVFSKRTCAYFVQHEQGYSSCSGVKLFWPSFPKIVHNAHMAASSQYPEKIEKALYAVFQKALFSFGCRAWRDGLYDELTNIVSIACSQPGDHEKIHRLQRCAFLSQKVPFLRHLFIAAYWSYQCVKRWSARSRSLLHALRQFSPNKIGRHA